jgi:hypothetical protein
VHRAIKISLLLFFFGLCAGAMIATHLARQRTPAPPIRVLYAVVSQQLSAFRADDFDDAYRQAAAEVQQKFSRTQFELMIRRDFSFMTEPAQVEFGAVRVAGGSALVQVFLRAHDGTVRGFLYSFTAESGAWKIDGVEPLGPQPARHLPGLHV